MIEKGTTIYEGQPFACVVKKEHRASRCDHCLQRGQLQKCSGCQYVRYCNRDCQKGAWKVHKSECKHLEKYYRESGKDVENIIWLMARVAIRLSRGGNNEKDYYTKTNYRRFQDLMSHADNIKKDPRKWSFFQILCNDLKQFLPQSAKLKSEELLEIYGRLEINNFTMVNLDESANLGIGLYLGASVIDHSCDPNVISLTNGTTMKIITIKDLPDLDWSAIRCRYTDKYLHYTKGRRQDLLERYYFWCNCPKCSSPDPLSACPSSNCLRNCDPNDTKCSGCGRTFPASYRDNFDEIAKITTQCIQENKDKKDLAAIKSCLIKQFGILHAHNWDHLRTLKLAVDAIPSTDLEEIEFYVSRLIAGYMIHYGDYNRILFQYYFLLGCTKYQLKKHSESYEVLTKLQSMLKVVYEKDSSFLQKEQLDALIVKTQSLKE